MSPWQGLGRVPRHRLCIKGPFQTGPSRPGEATYRSVRSTDTVSSFLLGKEAFRRAGLTPAASPFPACARDYLTLRSATKAHSMHPRQESFWVPWLRRSPHPLYSECRPLMTFSKDLRNGRDVCQCPGTAP